MSRDDPLLRVRLPEVLKSTIQARATDSRRSMNAEIVRRLEWSLAAEADFAEFESKAEERSQLAAHRLLNMRGTGDADPYEERLQALENQVAEMRAKLGL